MAKKKPESQATQFVLLGIIIFIAIIGVMWVLRADTVPTVGRAAPQDIGIAPALMGELINCGASRDFKCSTDPVLWRKIPQCKDEKGKVLATDEINDFCKEAEKACTKNEIGSLKSECDKFCEKQRCPFSRLDVDNAFFQAKCFDKAFAQNDAGSFTADEFVNFHGGSCHKFMRCNCYKPKPREIPKEYPQIEQPPKEYPQIEQPKRAPPKRIPRK